MSEHIKEKVWRFTSCVRNHTRAIELPSLPPPPPPPKSPSETVRRQLLLRLGDVGAGYHRRREVGQKILRGCEGPSAEPSCSWESRDIQYSVHLESLVRSKPYVIGNDNGVAICFAARLGMSCSVVPRIQSAVRRSDSAVGGSTISANS